MSKEKSLDRIRKHLFSDLSEVSDILSPAEIQVKQRLMLSVTRVMEFPLTSDSDLVDFLLTGYGGAVTPVSKSQAYRDVAAVHMIVGDIQIPSKAWIRHMIIEGCKDIYKKALARNDHKGAAAALDKLGKYTRCDKDDETMDWSEMLPPVFEPSDDLTLIDGLDVIEPTKLESERRRLRELFGKMSSTTVEEAEIVGDEPES